MDILSILNPESAPATEASASAASAAPTSEHHPDQALINSAPPDFGIGKPVWPALTRPTCSLTHPAPPATYVLNSQTIVNPIQGAGQDDNTQHGILPREVNQRADNISQAGGSGITRNVEIKSVRGEERSSSSRFCCGKCEEVFNRQCDLTKHDLEHTRPWKCSHDDCLFSGRGFPSNALLQRHKQDKHNTATVTYKCPFLPCEYTGKRESNWKQHKEKRHGYKYIRSRVIKRSSKSSPRERKTPAGAHTHNGGRLGSLENNIFHVFGKAARSQGSGTSIEENTKS